jgi:hypothetical protein
LLQYSVLKIGEENSVLSLEAKIIILFNLKPIDKAIEDYTLDRFICKVKHSTKNIFGEVIPFSMLYTGGRIIFRFVGTLVRWVSTGFQKTFKDLWDGPEEFEHSLDYSFATGLIGFITIVVILFLITRC